MQLRDRSPRHRLSAYLAEEKTIVPTRGVPVHDRTLLHISHFQVWRLLMHKAHWEPSGEHTWSNSIEAPNGVHNSLPQQDLHAPRYFIPATYTTRSSLN